MEKSIERYGALKRSKRSQYNLLLSCPPPFIGLLLSRNIWFLPGQLGPKNDPCEFQGSVVLLYNNACTFTHPGHNAEINTKDILRQPMAPQGDPEKGLPLRYLTNGCVVGMGIIKDICPLEPWQQKHYRDVTQGLVKPPETGCFFSQLTPFTYPVSVSVEEKNGLVPTLTEKSARHIVEAGAGTAKLKGDVHCGYVNSRASPMPLNPFSPS